MTHLIILACWNALIASCLKVSNKQEFTWPMHAIRELENMFAARTSYLFELAFRKFATELTTVRVFPWSFMFPDHWFFHTYVILCTCDKRLPSFRYNININQAFDIDFVWKES